MKFNYILLLTAILLIVQTPNLAQYKSIDLRTGYSWQDVHSLEFDLGYAVRDTGWWVGYSKAYFGGEYIFNLTDKNPFGLKLGYTISALLPFFNFQVIYYTDLSKNSFHLNRKLASLNLEDGQLVMVIIFLSLQTLLIFHTIASHYDTNLF